ncbi:hypothetical protein B9Z55_025296 [Caenorhabditis nigoni]|uniref:Nuclear transcription factor Y subunit n=1 Tax=Caenorhabditis nigoni TaxID=1611254 RepID=A0A2G5SYC6_9PELO|nr:hypothetical protein B9Z55_025296 [Caenorhabditis nigoni]
MNGSLSRGPAPRTATITNHDRKPIPPSVFTFRKTTAAEMKQASTPKSLSLVNKGVFTNPEYLKHTVRPPIRQQAPPPVTVPPIRKEPIRQQYQLPEPIIYTTATGYQHQQEEEDDDDGPQYALPAEHLFPNYDPPPEESFQSEPTSTQYDEQFSSTSSPVSTSVSTAYTTPISTPNVNPNFSQVDTTTPSSYSNTSFTNEPVFKKAYTVSDNVPSSSTDIAQSSASGDGQEADNSNTIELPTNCKLFQYQWVVDGIPRTLLVPMPINATEQDVREMLPSTLNVDPEELARTFRADTSKAEITTLSLPGGGMPTIETADDDDPQEEYAPEYEESGDYDEEADEYSPILVNPKQYHRIVRRREMRQRLEASGRLPLSRQKYLHESRHRHALNRKRGIDGRFDNALLAGRGGEDDDDDEDDDEVSTTTIRPIDRRLLPKLAPIAAGPGGMAPVYKCNDYTIRSVPTTSANMQNTVQMIHNGGQTTTTHQIIHHDSHNPTMMMDPNIPSTSTGIYETQMIDHQQNYMNAPMNSYDDYTHGQYEADTIHYQDNAEVGVDLTGADGQSFTNL